jgi:alpha-tubulin suppressor-like RCC1 family protein
MEDGWFCRHAAGWMVAVAAAAAVLACSPVSGADAPRVRIVDGPGELSRLNTAEFELECLAAGCRLECAVGEGPFTPCFSPHVIADLLEGEHTFAVRGVNQEGRVGEAVHHTWRVHTEAPTVTFVEHPPPVTGESGGRVAFECPAGETCAFECAVNGASWASCLSPLVLSGLQPGVHAVAVRAIDAAGNKSDAVAVSWRIRSDGPQVRIVAGPPPASAQTTATFEVDCGEGCDEIHCQLGQETPGPCPAPIRYDDLPDGDYRFQVWGRDATGRLGPGDERWFSVSTAWQEVASGFGFVCALATDASLWCWGNNHWLQLGDGTGTRRSSPTRIPGRWKAVAAGGPSACAIRENDTLWCWGMNIEGGIGDGTPFDRPQPVQEATVATWRTAALGLYGCGIRNADASLWCWGRNEEGTLGDGTLQPRYGPVRIGGDHRFRSVSTGQLHACAIDESDAVWCWGANRAGQAGVADTEVVTTPQRAVDTEPYATVATGHGLSCGIRTDGTLWCWGQLPFEPVEGAPAPGPSPRRMAEGTGWRSVSPTFMSLCAVDASGALWCGGSNMAGNLGDPEIEQAQSLVRVGDDDDWVAVTSGVSWHTCGLKTDGSLWCWGLFEMPEVLEQVDALESAWMEPVHMAGPYPEGP